MTSPLCPGLHRAGRALHPLAALETPGLGAAHQGDHGTYLHYLLYLQYCSIYSTYLQFCSIYSTAVSTVLQYLQYYSTAVPCTLQYPGEPGVARPLHPGHGLHHDRPHGRQASGDWAGLPHHPHRRPSLLHLPLLGK